MSILRDVELAAFLDELASFLLQTNFERFLFRNFLLCSKFPDRHLNRRLSRPDLTACRIQQSTGEISKFEANLAKVLLGSSDRLN